MASWLGSRAREFENAEDLLNFVNSHQTDIVILDAAYPEVSGFFIAEKLKAAKADIRIIIISNNVSIGLFEKARYAGVDHILEAPFSPDELEALL